MKDYTVKCQGKIISMTDKYECAFKLGERFVVETLCENCQVLKSD